MHFALPRSRRLSDKEPPVGPDAAINRAGANRPRRSDLVFTNDKVSTRQACFASCGMFLGSVVFGSSKRNLAPHGQGIAASWPSTFTKESIMNFTVGVGITIAHDPLHGSGRAGFPHPALALGNNAHAPQRIGMTDRRHRQPASDEAPHAIPEDAAVLTAPRQRAMPKPADSESKNCQRRQRPLGVPALEDKIVQRATSRFPREVLPYVLGVSDRAGLWCTSRYRRTRWGLPLSPTASASRSDWLSRLNTRPAHSLVNA